MSDEAPAQGQRRRRRNRRSGRKRKGQNPGNRAPEQGAAERNPDTDSSGDSRSSSAQAAHGAIVPSDKAGAEKSEKPGRRRRQDRTKGSKGNRSRNDQAPSNKDTGRGRYRHTYGVIDLGTNNCRLLVAKPVKSGGFRVVDAYSRIVRLGEGVGQTGALSEAAMARSLEALELCARKMKRRGVTSSWSVATQACRLASNGEDFRQAVKERTGLTLDIIEPEREARLAVGGCRPLIRKDVDRALVFDIGGGSTELIWLDVTGDTPRIIDWTSLEVGVVTLTEQYAGSGANGLGHVDVSQDSYDAMIAQVEQCMAPFAEKYATDNGSNGMRVQVLGTSGTVTTLAGVYLGLPRYDRNKVDGVWMPRQAIHDISQRLSVMPYEQRILQPCIGKERGDLVVAGCAILEAICTAWPTEQVRVADRGLREGMLLELMEAADKADAVGKFGPRGSGKPKRRRRGGRNRRRNKSNASAPAQPNAGAGEQS